MSEKPSAPRKRRYVEKPDKRALLLDAAQQIILEEGYAAATARHIASKIGLKHQVVFYYFDTQYCLLVALHKRIADNYAMRLTAALNSENPLGAMWQILSDPKSTRFALEYMALANHNENIRSLLAENTRDFRSLETEAITRYYESRGHEPPLPPELISILIHAVARLYVQESTLGIHSGHDTLEQFVSNAIGQLEPGKSSLLALAAQKAKLTG